MKVFVAALAAVVAVLVPATASAHPLGNFTVNHYARVEPSRDALRVFYVLDQAEIPTFQDKPRIDADQSAFADQRAEELRQHLRLTLDGTPVPLALESRKLSLPDGAGGLPTLRLEATFVAPVQTTSAHELQLRDDNDPTRIGWREIVATSPDSSITIQRSSVPAADVTDALHAYPDDLLNSPLDVRSATLTLAPATVGDTSVEPTSDASKTFSPAASGIAALDRAQRAFADLANVDTLTPAFVLFAVGVALVLGAAHALQPGHGKTVVAAYLVGSRGTPKHALFLGATVTATHTAGVYALGVVTLLLSQYIVPERLYPVVEAGSGVLVVIIGGWLFIQRLRAARHRHSHAHGDHTHTHGGHAHTHAPPVSWRSLLALGISGGALPCPEALMVLLITIAAHRILFGLLLIVAFSSGLASVLVGFGLLLVYARGVFGRVNLSSGLPARFLPLASAMVIVLAGSVITVQALPQVL